VYCSKTQVSQQCFSPCISHPGAGNKIGKRTQLDDESDSAHDAEADANSLAQLEKLLLVG
jgi:hypothetical protein